MVIRHIYENTFSQRKETDSVQGGLVLIEYLPTDTHAAYIVIVNDELVPPEQWSSRILQDGDILIVRPFPEGGDRNTLKDVASVAAALAASVATMGIAGAGWSTATKIGASLLATGGYMTLNYMLTQPPVQPEEISRDPVYSITGIKNRIMKGGVIPRVYGKMKVYPPLAAQPYTEIAGDDQYINMLFCVGKTSDNTYLSLDNFKIGSTDLSDYNDYNLEYTTGNTGDDSLPSLFQNSIYETYPNRKLIGDTWITETTRSDKNAEELSVDITYPEGLYGVNSDGNLTARTSTVELQYKLSSDSTWLPDTTNIAPSLDEWTLSTGAQYSAPEIILDSDGESAHSGLIATAYNATRTNISMDCFSTDTTDPVVAELYVYRRADDSTHSYYSFASDYVAAASTYETLSWTFDHPPGWWIKIRFKIDATGSSAFKSVSDLKFKNPAVTSDIIIETTGKTASTLRNTHRWKVDTAGQYDIRLKRTSNGSGGAEDGYWTTTRVIDSTAPISDTTNLSLVALRIRSTKQLSGMLDNFNLEASSYLYGYSAGAWGTFETANPAWVYYDIAVGSGNYKAVAASRVDTDTLKTWATFCDTEGYEFNASIDSEMTVLEALKAVCAAGQASFGFADTDYSVVHDRVQTSPKQLISPRNSWGFEGVRNTLEMPHGLKIGFINDENGWGEDERTVYYDGYTSSNATNIIAMQWLGVTQPDQVYKLARYHLACLWLRPETFTVNMDWEHLAANRGDMVRVNNDTIKWGLGFARVIGTSELAGVYIIDIDDTFTMSAGYSYAIRYRTVDSGTTYYYELPIQFNSGDNTQVTTYTTAAHKPLAGDLIVFGVQGSDSSECIIKSIEPNNDLSAKLTLVEYNDAIYDAYSGTIPDWDSKIIHPPEPDRKPVQPIIYQVRSNEDVMYRGIDGTYQPRILIDLMKVSDTPVDTTSYNSLSHEAPEWVHIEYRESDAADERWIRLPIVSADEMQVDIKPVETGVEYDYRLRYVSANYRTSAWTTRSNYEVVGKSTNPPDVSDINYKQPNRLEWNYDAPKDHRGFEVRYNIGSNTSWDEGTKAHDGWVTTSYYDIGSFTGGTITWLVKAIDTAGNYSDSAQYIVRNLGDPDTNNVIKTIDYGADNYPGKQTDCTVSGTELQADEETSLFYGADEGGFYADRGSSFYGSTYKAMNYVFSVYPEQAYAGDDIWLDYTSENLRDIKFRRSDPTDTEGFTNLDDWTVDGDGTFTATGGVLEVQYDGVAGGNQSLTWDTISLPTNTSKFFVSLKVKSSDVSATNFGVLFASQSYQWKKTKHNMSVDGDTTNNPAMTDDTYAMWLFEVLADGTVNWYVDGDWIGSGSTQSSNTGMKIWVSDDTGSNTITYDDIKVWKPTGGYLVWPGRITSASEELYEFQVRSYAGADRGKLTALDVKIDVDDVIEYQDDVAISSGSTRLTLVKTFDTITNIQLTVQSSGAETAVSAKALDKQATAGSGNGPDIECYDAAGNSTDGHVDVTIKGY